MASQNIHLIQGDITTLDVDCIVNAAHEALMGGGGVDGAIHRAAGPQLLAACREIPQIEPGIRCNVGYAHITEAFNLPSEYIIHTVAPKWIGGVVKREINSPNDLRESDFVLTQQIYSCAKEGTEEDLKKCYLSCLNLADENNIKSIAFPSLGTGGHAFPIELASVVAYETVLETLPKTNIEDVYFVCFSDFDSEQYLKLFE